MQVPHSQVPYSFSSGFLVCFLMSEIPHGPVLERLRNTQKAGNLLIQALKLYQG